MTHDARLPPAAEPGRTTLDRPQRRGPAAPLWTLRVLFDGVQVVAGGPRPLAAGRLVLGRATAADWGHAEDPLLSRQHLLLELRGGRLWAEDLDSRNGSAVNGRPLDGRRALRSGDLLRLGDTFLLVRQVDPGQRPTPARGPLAGLRGDSPAMHALRRELSQVGPGRTSVMLRGGSGVGKSASAAALHALSGRRGPLVSVNCAAIAEHLAESTLFGHVRGAFTGAERAHPGFFQEASGGTLFLDEVADLPAPLQPKLLHAVEAGEVIPVGSARPVPVDLRIVAATSLGLEAAVAGGRFRGELLARLAEYVVHLPDLRARVEDVLPLFSAATGDRPLHPDLVDLLLRHPWPYNVRELQNVAAEIAVRGADRAVLDAGLAGGRLEPLLDAGEAEGDGAPGAPSAAGPPQREAVLAALRAAGGQVSAAARRLGRSRRQLYRDLARLGIDPDELRP